MGRYAGIYRSFDNLSRRFPPFFFSLRLPSRLSRLRGSIPWSRQRRAAFGSGAGGGIELEAEAVREASEVVEDADNVCDFQAGVVVEAERTQWLPVLLNHSGRCCAHLFRDRAEGALAVGQIGKITPPPRLDRFDQCRIAVLDTQKLRVGRRSVVAILRGCRDARYHFPLLPR